MRLIDADALMLQVTKKMNTMKGSSDFKDALLRVRSMIHSSPTIETCGNCVGPGLAASHGITDMRVNKPESCNPVAKLEEDQYILLMSCASFGFKYLTKTNRKLYGHREMPFKYTLVGEGNKWSTNFAYVLPASLSIYNMVEEGGLLDVTKKLEGRE